MGSYLNARSTLADQERVLFIDDTDGDSILSKCQGADETDGTSTEDSNALVGLDSTDVRHGVDTDGERLHHRTVFEGQVVGELVAEVSWDGVVPAESTIVRRSRGEDDIWAELHKAFRKS